MKAAVLEAVEKVTVRDDVAEPAIGPRDVLVRSRAYSACGTDVHIWKATSHHRGREHRANPSARAFLGLVTTEMPGREILVEA